MQYRSTHSLTPATDPVAARVDAVRLHIRASLFVTNIKSVGATR